MVYVLSKEGTPLMPTNRHGRVRHLLDAGESRKAVSVYHTAAVSKHDVYTGNHIRRGCRK